MGSFAETLLHPPTPTCALSSLSGTKSVVGFSSARQVRLHVHPPVRTKIQTRMAFVVNPVPPDLGRKREQEGGGAMKGYSVRFPPPLPDFFYPRIGPFDPFRSRYEPLPLKHMRTLGKRHIKRHTSSQDYVSSGRLRDGRSANLRREGGCLKCLLLTSLRKGGAVHSSHPSFSIVIFGRDIGCA